MTDGQNKKPDKPQTQHQNVMEQLAQRQRARSAGHAQGERDAAYRPGWNPALEIGIRTTGGEYIPTLFHKNMTPKSVKKRILITEHGIYCKHTTDPIPTLKALSHPKEIQDTPNHRSALIAVFLAWYGSKEAYKDFTPGKQTILSSQERPPHSDEDAKEQQAEKAANEGKILRLAGSDRKMVVLAAALCASIKIPYQCDYVDSNLENLIAIEREKLEAFGLTGELRDKPLHEVLSILADPSKLDALAKKDAKHYKIISKTKFNEEEYKAKGQAFLKDLSLDLRDTTARVGLLTDDQYKQLDPNQITMSTQAPSTSGTQGLSIRHRRS